MPFYYQTRKRKSVEDKIVKAAIQYIASWIRGNTVVMKNAQTELYRAVREHPDWMNYRFINRQKKEE